MVMTTPDVQQLVDEMMMAMYVRSQQRAASSTARTQQHFGR